MTKTILAVDDSRTIREMVRACLTDAGFDVTVAEDGEAGLEALRGFEPDAMITDVNMPKLDGFGFIDGVRCQPQFKTTPILVLTTESSAELKAKARDKGATGWITKPFNGPRLVAVLDRLVG